MIPFNVKLKKNHVCLSERKRGRNEQRERRGRKEGKGEKKYRELRLGDN